VAVATSGLSQGPKVDTYARSPASVADRVSTCRRNGVPATRWTIPERSKRASPTGLPSSSTVTAARPDGPVCRRRARWRSRCKPQAGSRFQHVRSNHEHLQRGRGHLACPEKTPDSYGEMTVSRLTSNGARRNGHPWCRSRHDSDVSRRVSAGARAESRSSRAEDHFSIVMLTIRPSRYAFPSVPRSNTNVVGTSVSGSS